MGVLDEAAVLEGDGGLVQEGNFWGAGGDRDLWGGCLAVTGECWGFGGTGHGSGWDLGV